MTPEQEARLAAIREEMARLNDEALTIVQPTEYEVWSLFEQYADDYGFDAAELFSDYHVWGNWEEFLSIRDSIREDHEEHVREMRKGGAPESGCPLCEEDQKTVDSTLSTPKEGEHNEGSHQ